MRIAVCGDVHLCQYSSILRGRGEKYSLRLENCIQSVNYFEQMSKGLGCDSEVFLGDFFDTCDLKAEEITAVNDIIWNELPKTFLCGNHEMGRSDLVYSSAHIFSKYHLVTKPEYDSTTHLAYLPYILECDRKPLREYFPDNPRIIFSHNDIKDFQMGRFLSVDGFSISEIQENCDLYLNGHLHNGGKVADKVFNVGNLTGQNFSEDATKYDHVFFVVDTDSLRIEVYDNKYALNFYKVDCTKGLNVLDEVQLPNAVVTAKCLQSKSKEVKQYLTSMQNVLESRLVIQPERTLTKDISDDEDFAKIDHLSKFVEFVRINIGTDDITLSELKEVCS